MVYEQLKLQNQICFRLYTVSRLVIQAYRPYLDSLGITYPQYLVLLLLWEQDNRVVSDISERLLLESNTVTPLLQRMERDGLIVRTRGVVDSRQKIVSLTKKGKHLEEEAKDIPYCILKSMEGCGADVDELTQVVAPLDRLIQTLKTQK